MSSRAPAVKAVDVFHILPVASALTTLLASENEELVMRDGGNSDGQVVRQPSRKDGAGFVESCPLVGCKAEEMYVVEEPQVISSSNNTEHLVVGTCRHGNQGR